MTASFGRSYDKGAGLNQYGGNRIWQTSKEWRSGYIVQSHSTLPLLRSPTTEGHLMPARRVTTQRMYARLELDGGLARVARPLCVLPRSTSVYLIKER